MVTYTAFTYHHICEPLVLLLVLISLMMSQLACNILGHTKSNWVVPDLAYIVGFHSTTINFRTLHNAWLSLIFWTTFNISWTFLHVLKLAIYLRSYILLPRIINPLSSMSRQGRLQITLARRGDQLSSAPTGFHSFCLSVTLPHGHTATWHNVGNFSTNSTIEPTFRCLLLLSACTMTTANYEAGSRWRYFHFAQRADKLLLEIRNFKQCKQVNGWADNDRTGQEQKHPTCPTGS